MKQMRIRPHQIVVNDMGAALPFEFLLFHHEAFDRVREDILLVMYESIVCCETRGMRVPIYALPI